MARPDVVPVPLTSGTWSQILGRSLTSSTLFAAILSDPEAALLAHGLSALDDQTLEFFASHPSLLTAIYRQHATVFATFPAHLHVRDGRVVPPGDDRAVALWEGALGQRAGNPVAFVTALYAKSGGRLAYLYDILGDLDESQRAFALGLWLPDPVMRAQRFNALARAAADLFGEWKPADVPFARPVSDLLMLLQRVQVEPSGAPRAPASQSFWSLALSGVREIVEPSGMAGPAIDAAWLADALLDGVAEARGARLDQFAFGHRVFTSTGDTDVTSMVDAIRRFPRTPLLMLTLERIGVQRAATFAALARHAQKLTVLDAEQEQRALAQLQGTVALITRLVTVGTIDRAVAEGLLETLSRTPVDSDRGYLGAITAFLARDLAGAIGGPSSASLDERLLRALSGRPDRNPVMRISWEGQSYVFDLVASESARLRRFLESGRGASLDAALSAYRTAAVLPSGDTARRADRLTRSRGRHDRRRALVICVRDRLESSASGGALRSRASAAPRFWSADAAEAGTRAYRVGRATARLPIGWAVARARCGPRSGDGAGAAGASQNRRRGPVRRAAAARDVQSRVRTEPRTSRRVRVARRRCRRRSRRDSAWRTPRRRTQSASDRRGQRDRRTRHGRLAGPRTPLESCIRAGTRHEPVLAERVPPARWLHTSTHTAGACRVCTRAVACAR